jgi:hypothetical protein
MEIQKFLIIDKYQAIIMRPITRFIILLVSFFIGLYFGFILFGAITHENSHAFTCIIFGGKILNYSLANVIYDSSSLSPILNLIIRLAGGMGQALYALFFLWGTTYLEKKSQKWFLAAMGLEISFLSISFMGFITAFWEGFFYENYRVNVNNSISFSILVVSMMAVSSFIIIKLKRKKLNALIIADEI